MPRGGKREGAGRKPGSSNKAINATEFFKTHKINPLLELHKIALKDSSSDELRTSIYTTLAKYAAPQLKAVEHSGDLGLAVVVKQYTVKEKNKDKS